MNGMKRSVSEKFALFCVERFALPSGKKIAEFESTIGSTLPEDYKWFLGEFNGGYFEGCKVGLPDDVLEEMQVDELELAVLFGLNLKGANEEDAALDTDDNLTFLDDNPPPMLLPIGRTQTDLYIILDLSDSSVVIYKSDRECWSIVSSFSDFITLLVPCS